MNNPNTMTKDVRGLKFTDRGIKVLTVVVRATNDRVGKSLSFQTGNEMVEIPCEDIMDLLKHLTKE